MLKCKERHSNIGYLAAIVRAERDKTNYCTFGWLCVSGEGSIQEQRPL